MFHLDYPPVQQSDNNYQALLRVSVPVSCESDNPPFAVAIPYFCASCMVNYPEDRCLMVFQLIIFSET